MSDTLASRRLVPCLLRRQNQGSAAIAACLFFLVTATCVTLPACGRSQREAPTVASSESAVPSATSSASNTTSASSQPQLAIRLIARPAGDGAAQVLLAVSTQEPVPIAIVKGAWTCLGAPADVDTWAVHCLPSFQTEVAHVRRESNRVSIHWETLGHAEQRTVPWVQPPPFDSLSESLSSVRDLPGADCARPTSEDARPVRITLEATHDINRRNDLLYLGFGTGRVLRIAEHWAWKGCAAHRDSGAVVVACPPSPKQTYGRFWLESTDSGGTFVRFEWRDTKQHAGAVLLPCGARPVLELPAGFAGGIHDYG